MYALMGGGMFRGGIEDGGFQRCKEESYRSHTGASRPALSRQDQGKCVCGSTLVLRRGSDFGLMHACSSASMASRLLLFSSGCFLLQWQLSLYLRFS